MEKKHELFNVKISVISVKECSAGLKVGDIFRISVEDGFHMEGCDGWCPEAVHSAIPPCMIMVHGGSMPWENENGVATFHCPDPKGIVMAVQRDGKLS